MYSTQNMFQLRYMFVNITNLYLFQETCSSCLLVICIFADFNVVTFGQKVIQPLSYNLLSFISLQSKE